MMDEHDRLEAQATEIKARQKRKESAVPLRCLTQIRNLALTQEGYAWDLVIALSDEALTALGGPISPLPAPPSSETNNA